MGCPNVAYLDGNVKFSIRTHDPSLDGALSDADAPPTYRIYENDTSTPILIGTMPKLDDANTLGLYAKVVTCSTLNGFQINNVYTVSINAIVNGVEGGISYEFILLALPSTTAIITSSTGTTIDLTTRTAYISGLSWPTRLIWFFKDPDASLDYTLDWSGWLASADTISSVTWIVPTGITEVTNSSTTTAAVIWLSGGTIGISYNIVCRIVTTAGRIDDRTMIIMIKET